MYDMIVFPVSELEQEKAGKMFKNPDCQSSRQIQSLIDNKYELDSFTVANGMVYFLFKK